MLLAFGDRTITGISKLISPCVLHPDSCLLGLKQGHKLPQEPPSALLYPNTSYSIHPAAVCICDLHTNAKIFRQFFSTNFFLGPVVLESICYHTREKQRIDESNTTGGLIKIWTGSNSMNNKVCKSRWQKSVTTTTITATAPLPDTQKIWKCWFWIYVKKTKRNRLQ